MITEYLMRLGSFEVQLVPDTPGPIRRALQLQSTLVVTEADLASSAPSAAEVVEAARYSGMVRTLSFLRDRIGGFSAAGFLGDDGNPMVGPWPYFQTDQWNDTFTNIIETDVWSPTSGLRNGIAVDVQGAVSGTAREVNVAYESSHTLSGTTVKVGILPVRAQLDTVCQAFGYEWWFDPTGTMIAGFPPFTSPLTAKVLVAPETDYATGNESGGVNPFGFFGSSIDVTALRLLTLDGEDHSKNYADNLQMNLTPPDGVTSTTLGFSNAADLFRGFAGSASPEYIASIIRPGAATTGQANAQAAQIRTQEFSVGSDVRSIEVECYDIGRHLIPGDYFGLYEPQSGFSFSSSSTSPWVCQGRVVPAQTVRCHGYTWPIREGYGVFHIASDGSGAVTRLTPFIDWEDGPVRLEVNGLPNPMTRRVKNFAGR